MRKLHWVSIVLLAAPIAFASACGDDDSGGGATGGSTGTGGGGTGGGGTGGGGTGGSETGGTTGTGGSETGGTTGTGGTVDDGGTGGSADDGGGTGGAADDGGGTEGGGEKVCPDDYPQMVAQGATCRDYCDCMMATCASKFADDAACMTACAAITVDQLCCRTYHCDNATKGNTDTHCGHAVGMDLCQ